MSTHPPNTSVGGASPAVYIEQLESLREEMQAAMLAISGNRLSVLEESLWRQRVLCTSLKHLSSTINSNPFESSLMRRIQESTAALHEVSRTYSALLQQASESGDLLYRLSRSYKDAAAPSLHGVTSARPLSCEA